MAIVPLPPIGNPIQFEPVVLRVAGTDAPIPGFTMLNAPVESQTIFPKMTGVVGYSTSYYDPIAIPEGATRIKIEIDLTQFPASETDVFFGFDFSADQENWQFPATATTGPTAAPGSPFDPMSFMETACPKDDQGATVFARPFVGLKNADDIGITIYFS